MTQGQRLQRAGWTKLAARPLAEPTARALPPGNLVKASSPVNPDQPHHRRTTAWLTAAHGRHRRGPPAAGVPVCGDASSSCCGPSASDISFDGTGGARDYHPGLYWSSRAHPLCVHRLPDLTWLVIGTSFDPGSQRHASRASARPSSAVALAAPARERREHRAAAAARRRSAPGQARDLGQRCSKAGAS